MFRTLLAKEFLEQRRTSKLWIFMAVFFIVGCISPLLAKYTPELLRSIPNMTPEYEELITKLIPTPGVKDAIDQYVKNTSQFGVLLIIVLTMNVIAQERERGTAAMLFSKPVKRSAFVASKWLASMTTVIASVIIGGIACAVYTFILFGSLPIGKFLLFNLLLLLFLAVYLSVALLASALARSQGMAAAIAFGFLAILLVVSTLPRISDYAPVGLTNWGLTIMLGGSKAQWPALFVSLAIMAVSLLVAWLYLDRQEI
jgi:ABC-2 type transport system permease protein